MAETGSDHAGVNGAANRVARGNILITSASRKAPLIRAMQNAVGRIDRNLKVIAGDIDPQAPTRFVADGFWEMSSTNDQTVPELISGCKEQGISAILPTRDGELAFWAKYSDVFAEAGIKVVVSPAQSVARCLDKLAFSKFGVDAELPFIPAALSPEEFETDRFVVKERFGAGSEGIGLDLDRDTAMAHADSLQNPIYQPFIEGEEISIDAWVDQNGVPAGVVLRRRDKVVNGESAITTTFRDPAIEAEAISILKALDLRGPIVMQMLISADQKIHVIEVNARFGGASTTSQAVGLDSLYWSCTEAFGLLNETPKFIRSDQDVRQVRLPADMLIYDPDL